MNNPQPMNQSGISAKLAGIAAALLEHVIALFSLAGLEARQLARQTFLCILLALSALLLVLAGYLTLLAMLLTIAVFSFQMSWPLALGIATFAHFTIAGLLLLLVYRKQATPSFILTRTELQCDLEALSSMSRDEASRHSFHENLT